MSAPLLLALAVVASAAAQEAVVSVPAPVVAAEPAQPASSSRVDKLDTTGIIRDSLSLLAFEHVGRIIFQEKTRRELRGPFWHDYVSSIRMPKTWSDGDGWLVNYVGHPIHGAAAGFIFLKHDPRSGKEQFGLSTSYWKTRWRPTVFAALYSVQFEVGPLSEASIGNVGMHADTTGWVDYVVTPLGAMAFLVAEDAVDRYFVQWAEARVGNKAVRSTMRIFFGPSQALANMAMGRLPWHRDSRPLGWRR